MRYASMTKLTITRRGMIVITAALFVAACEDQSKRPFIEIVGGGFVLNYRYSELTYGVLVRQNKPFPPGAVLEASFDKPGTTEKQVISVAAVDDVKGFKFESGPVVGAKKDEKYTVVVRLLDKAGGKELGRAEKTFMVQIDLSTLPQQPLVIGPGYQKGPGYGEIKPKP